MKKKDLIEFTVIIAVAVCISVIFNTASGHNIPLFSSYKPLKKDPIISGKPVDSLEDIDMEVFRYLRERKNTVVLDARNEDEYKRGHIPGAFNFPLSDFDTFFKERGAFLKKGKTVITYCSGKNCNDSAILAIKLKRKGVKDVLRFPGGIEEWVDGGNITEGSER